MATLSVWMEVEAHQFDPVASKLNWELVFKPMFGIPTDNAAVEENEAKLVKVLGPSTWEAISSPWLICTISPTYLAR
jgi:glutathione S-transferase